MGAPGSQRFKVIQAKDSEWVHKGLKGSGGATRLGEEEALVSREFASSFLS